MTQPLTSFPEEGLYATLIADPVVSSIVKDRVYPIRIPKQSFDDTILPCIVFQKVVGTEEYTHDGPAGLVEPHFTVTCFTDGDPMRGTRGFFQCLALEKAVTNALSRLTHAWDQLDASVMFLNSVDRFEPQSQTFQRVITFMVYHQEVQ